MTHVTPAEVELPPFIPKRGLSNGHAMTIFAWARRRRYPDLPHGEPRLFQTTADTHILAHCYWQPDRQARPTLIAIHGLEGSSDGHYMLGMALQAWRRGWSAVLLNHRNCGGTEHLTPTLYHSGLTEDAFAVIGELAGEGLRDFGVAGYSLGGNVTLRLAGEFATVPSRAGLPIRAVAAVSPTIDLDACTTAIERPVNRVYEWNFIRNMRARMRRKALRWPGRFDVSRLGRVSTIRGFDDAYTAPHAGFGNAANYYFQASAIRLIDRVTVPTLIVSALDDPFVPGEQFQRPEVTGNANVRVLLTPHGGHCGFVSAAGYWAEDTVVRFLAAFMPA
jgi:predicted alpha/beta-fold hydrolase